MALWAYIPFICGPISTPICKQRAPCSLSLLLFVFVCAMCTEHICPLYLLILKGHHTQTGIHTVHRVHMRNNSTIYALLSAIYRFQKVHTEYIKLRFCCADWELFLLGWLSGSASHTHTIYFSIAFVVSINLLFCIV